MSWENKVRKTIPYTAGEQPKNKNIIKLNTNECPYPPAPGVKKAISELGLRSDDLRLDPQNHRHQQEHNSNECNYDTF